MLDKLCQKNWRKPLLPRRWLRSLYRREFLHRRREGVTLPFEKDFYDYRYRGDICNIIDFHCFFYGAFEKGHLMFWRDVAAAVCDGHGVYLDIGANVGHHSLFMSRHCVSVHAFEPYPPVREKISDKIELNKLTNITVHEVGLGIENELIPFYPPTSANLGIGSFINTDAGSPIQQAKLQVVRGDDYFPRHLKGKIDMIKIDVEGFEKNVIAGCRETLHRNRPVMVVELSRDLNCSFTSRREFMELLPENCLLFMFDLFDTRGKKDKGKESAFRKKGTYRLIPFDFHLTPNQVDVIVFPIEKYERLQASAKSPG